ncbi:MAG TPA: ChbG/HpnK family deacetylase [Solirubrobacterales bacterium]|nr:ChbG/HpnK family deacetylase [Solirubrobacterales bacterium]
MGRDRGLLIVNADDWGYDEPTTRAIADCHQAAGLTSTTAMMFMAGSEEAAALAGDHPRLGIGLHLNLFEEYSGASVPTPVRDRQSYLLDRFRRQRLRRWIYDPRCRHQVDRVVADQLERFVELYGRQPTHVDGHHHSHMAVNVLLSRSLPRGIAIRNALSDTYPHNAIAEALRALRRQLVLSRYRSTDYFFSIETVWPGLTGVPPEEKLGLSRHHSVEVMVHPGFPHEYGPLQSPEWAEALRRLPTGTFAGL